MSFATRTELMPHQVAAVAKMLSSRVGALFMEMGTGKSRTLIELAHLRREKWDRLFWFCPVALKETVTHQLLLHTDLRRDDIAVWGDKVATHDLPSDQRIHIIGIESMSSSDRTVLAYRAMVTPRSFVAVDESGYIKGHKSNRTTRITDLSEPARYRLIMTGTPFTQGVVDLFAQMRFLSPRILGYRSFHTFARNHLEYKTRKDEFGREVRTGQIIRSHDTEVLAAKIAPYTYQVRKDECLTLPEKVHTTRWCRMTPEQRRLYDDVKERILYELEYDDWSPIRIFHLFTALQTVVCGWYADPVHGLYEVEHNRLALLLATVAEIPAGERVIVWAKYRRAVDEISQALAAAYGHDHVRRFYGDLGEDQRNAELASWRQGGRFLVATQSVGGHGLTLNEAAYAVFYADGFRFSERLQAEDRNHRIGQARRTTYITLSCFDSIDVRIAAAIERKCSALAAFMGEVDEVRTNGLKQRAIDIVKAL
jgi:SNF2 family DNA or RNA helicase